MAASSVLSVPFRRSAPVDLSDVLRRYIASQYGQHPDSFREELSAINRLRKDAVNIQEAHPSGIEKLQSYCAQLSYMLGKCPTDIGAHFSWYSALGYSKDKPVEEDDVRFELASCLFNLVALLSQLGVAANASTDSGLKAGANYFAQAAGVASYLKDRIVPDLRITVEDLDIVTLSCLEKIMLAQAQECFWLKAVFNNLKDSTVAKLAAKVSDLYLEARDAAISTNSITADWIHHMTAKHFHFAAAAHFRAAADCLERRKYGEEVARLSACVNTIDQALKEKRWVNKHVLSDMQGLKQRAAEDLKRATRDNDGIYVDPVPSASELKTIDRVTMAKAVVPKEVSDAVELLTSGKTRIGKPLFQKLVPFAVHAAASIYAERRDRVINQNIIARYDQLADELRNLLQSLNLPASLQALEKPLGVPHTLINHAEEIRQQDGIERLQKSVRNVTKIKHRDQFLYDEAIEALRQEEEEDERLGKKYGTDRWARLDSRVVGEKVYRQASEYKNYMESAEASDELVVQKINESAPIIELYSGSTTKLQEFLPNANSGHSSAGKSRRDAENLRRILDEIDSVERKRRRDVDKLRQKAKADDINEALLNEAARLEREYPMQKLEPAHFEHLFERRLKSYDGDRQAAENEGKSQQRLEEELRNANDAFVQSRDDESDMTLARERKLKELEDGYQKYLEIVKGLEGGLEFYNNLGTLLERFRNSAKEFVTNRRNEARNLEAELANLERMRELDIRSQQQRSEGDQWQRQQRHQDQVEMQKDHYGQLHQLVNGAQKTAPSQLNLAPEPRQTRASSRQQQQHRAEPTAPPQNQTWTAARGAPTFGSPAATFQPHSASPPSTQPRMAYPTGNLPSIAQGIWTPDRPIVFGDAAMPQGGVQPPAHSMNSGKPRETMWSANQELRFG